MIPSKPSAVLDLDLKAVEPDLELEMDRPLAEEEGWQIARASFAREALHYSVRGGIALLILAALVLGGFWLIHKVQHLPPHVVNGAKQMIDPVLKANPFNSASENNPPAPTSTDSKAKVVSSSAGHSKASSTSKRRRRQVAKRAGHGHVRPVQAGDDPTGGRVTYSDGMITEYSWK
ncbi:hypothetical protein KBI23_04905 [bacterium]|nr:hypothetical protein [bacterium]MBP9807234.1 hypothetical protein [bacterium]